MIFRVIIHILALANKTITVTKYDDVRFEEKGVLLYLVCKYNAVDLRCEILSVVIAEYRIATLYAANDDKGVCL